jgi:hypothetical protein
MTKNPTSRKQHYKQSSTDSCTRWSSKTNIKLKINPSFQVRQEQELKERIAFYITIICNKLKYEFFNFYFFKFDTHILHNLIFA